MKNIPLEIVIPVFNEGEKILKLMDLFQKNIKTEFRVLFCYDLENDNLFNYKNELINRKMKGHVDIWEINSKTLFFILLLFVSQKSLLFSIT